MCELNISIKQYNNDDHILNSFKIYNDIHFKHGFGVGDEQLLKMIELWICYN